MLQRRRSRAIDPSALLKAGPGRSSRDLLVAGSAHGKVMLPRLWFWANKKNSDFSFSGFALSRGVVAARVKPVFARHWKEARRRCVEENFFIKKTLSVWF